MNTPGSGEGTKNKLLDFCIRSLPGVPVFAGLSPSQQQMYEQVESIKNPMDWDEEAFDVQQYHILLKELRIIEQNQQKYYALQCRLKDMKPIQNPAVGFYI